MALNEERLKVLKMIREGKITPEEGAQLLDALDEGVQAETTSTRGGQAAGGATKSSGRWFRVRVTDTNTGKTRVNVRMPLNVVNAGIKMGVRFAPQVEGLDVEKLTEFINDGTVGQLVDVYDEEDGEHVEVYIE